MERIELVTVYNKHKLFTILKLDKQEQKPDMYTLTVDAILLCVAYVYEN